MADVFESRFLLASLYIKTILRGTTIARRKRVLESIKDGVGLGDAYCVTLERIMAQDEEKTKLAIATLTWVCHSERPLQVDELRSSQIMRGPLHWSSWTSTKTTWPLYHC